LLTHIQFIRLWQTAFFWDEWQHGDIAKRFEYIDDDVWSLVRQLSSTQVALGLYLNTNPVLQITRSQEIAPKRVLITFEVSVLGQHLQTIQLEFMEPVMFSADTLRSIYEVLPSFILSKLTGI
jgi:hypothetical protein